MPKATANWLNHQYPKSAKAVAGTYRRSLSGKDGDTILEDLRRFCMVYDTTAIADRNGAIDPMHLAVNEGRRQVFLHVVGVLGLDETALEEPKGLDDERDQRRTPDGPEPKSRYSPEPDPYLDGPVTAARADTGTGNAE